MARRWREALWEALAVAVALMMLAGAVLGLVGLLVYGDPS